MKLVTTITAMCAVVLASSVAFGGQGADALRVAGFKTDKVFTRGQGAQVLQATVTHTKWIDGQYVAYLQVLWGDVDKVASGPQPTKTWKGKVEVDDGFATVVQTIKFEPNGSKTKVFDQDAYNHAVWLWKEKRASFLQEAGAQRQHARQKAFKTIHKRKKLKKILAKIDRQYAQDVADFDETMAIRLAKIKHKLTQTIIVDGDKVKQVSGDQVKWVASTGGGMDGVLIKLELDAPDSEVEIKPAATRSSSTRSRPGRWCTTRSRSPTTPGRPGDGALTLVRALSCRVIRGRRSFGSVITPRAVTADIIGRGTGGRVVFTARAGRTMARAAISVAASRGTTAGFGPAWCCGRRSEMRASQMRRAIGSSRLRGACNGISIASDITGGRRKEHDHAYMSSWTHCGGAGRRVRLSDRP